jgi:hypothetical protein
LLWLLYFAAAVAAAAAAGGGDGNALFAAHAALQLIAIVPLPAVNSLYATPAADAQSEGI